GVGIGVELHAKDLAPRVLQRISVILIERSLACRSRIHQKAQWALRNFGRVLDYRLLGDYGSAPYIDRHRIKARVDANRTSGYSLTSPEVVPDTARKFHVVGTHKFVHFGRNQQVRAEHEFRIGGLKVFLIGKFEEH